MNKNKIVYRTGQFHNIDRSILNKSYDSNTPNTAGFGEDFLNLGKSLFSNNNTESFANSFGDFIGALSGKTFSVNSNVNNAFSKLLNPSKKIGIGSYLSTGTNAVDAFKYASELADTSALEASIDNVRYNTSNATTLDQLQTDANNQNLFADVDRSDMRANSTGKVIGHTLGNMGKTFATAKGSILSKALQTAAVGLAGGLGAIRGNKLAGDKANLLNYQQDNAQLAQLTGLTNAQDNINRNLYGSAMINNTINAYGGPLNFDIMNLDNSYSYGGDLKFTGNFSNGVTKIDVGGTHEQNPLEGVPMGTDDNGTPNLVEEGEIIYDGYVYSNRLTPTEKQLESVNLPTKYKDYTYAKIAEEISKDSEERPNDPLSKSTLKANMAKLRTIHEETRKEKEEKKAKKEFESLPIEQQAALLDNAQQSYSIEETPTEEEIAMSQEQPQMFASGGNLFKEGGDSDSNKLDTAIISATRGDKYVPNFRELYKTIYKGHPLDGNRVSAQHVKNAYYQWLEDNRRSGKNVVVSNPERMVEILNPYVAWQVNPQKYAQPGKKISTSQNESTTNSSYNTQKTSSVIGPPLDVETTSPSRVKTTSGDVKTLPISNNSFNIDFDSIDSLRNNPLQSLSKYADYSQDESLQKYNPSSSTDKVSRNPNNSQYATWPRYAPVIGSAYTALNDLFNRPDYSAAERVRQEAYNMRPTRFSPIGEYLTYNPIDRNYLLNQMASANAATKRGIINSGSNRYATNAALLAAGYNEGNNIGNALMQMDQYNRQQRQSVSDFNRATDQYNSEGQLKADSLNAEIARARLAGVETAENMRLSERERYNNTRSANLTNLFNNIGAIGRENMAFNMANNNKSMYYGTDRNGNFYYKNDFFRLDPERQAEIARITGVEIPKKNGGYLTIKKNTRRK